MSGTPKSLAPVRTESGLVVRATSSLNDLIAITPKTRTEWVSAWRSHVPGQILTLRRVRRRDHRDHQRAPAGRPTPTSASGCGSSIWTRSLRPRRSGSPTSTSVAGRPGRGGVPAGSSPPGRSSGSTASGSDVTVAPAVGARGGRGHGPGRHGDRAGRDDRAAQVDRGAGGQGRPGSSATRWCVLQDQTAHGLDPATGERRWLRPFLGTFTELATFGDRLVLATADCDRAARRGRAGDRPAARRTCGSRSPADRMVGWGVRAGRGGRRRRRRSAGAGPCPA